MNRLLDAIVTNGLLFDTLGIIGLGILAMAALRLVRKDKSWGDTMMGYGAVAQLLARLHILTAPHYMDNDFLHAIGPLGIAMFEGLPPLLLTFDFAGVVWGLWGHEKWLKQGQTRQSHIQSKRCLRGGNQAHSLYPCWMRFARCWYYRIGTSV